VFFIARVGISLLGKVNRISDTVDNLRSCGAKIVGSDLVDLKPDWCVDLQSQ